MKKALALLLSLTVLSGLLAGCGTTAVVAVPFPTPEATPTPTPAPETEPPTEGDAVPVKTGFYISTSVGSSKDAAADDAGLAQADITIDAVTDGDDGLIV